MYPRFGYLGTLPLLHFLPYYYMHIQHITLTIPEYRDTASYKRHDASTHNDTPHSTNF